MTAPPVTDLPAPTVAQVSEAQNSSRTAPEGLSWAWALGGAAVVIAAILAMAALRRRRPQERVEAASAIAPQPARVPDRVLSAQNAAFTGDAARPAGRPVLHPAPAGASLLDAADRGPTPDNPFLTRRNRRKRARALMARARALGPTGAEATAESQSARPEVDRAARGRTPEQQRAAPQPARQPLRFGWPNSRPALGNA